MSASTSARMNPRVIAGIVAALVLLGLFLVGLGAPDHMDSGDAALALKSPFEVPPFGTDERGRPLSIYLAQGARIIIAPAIFSALLVAFLGIIGGLIRCTGSSRADNVVQAFQELVGSLPRMVVILVVALLVPQGWRGLLPLALAWALLSGPGAMDEAAAVAERLGGARFVEALRAHGFGWSRIYLYHVVYLNLSPVVVRQGAETLLQVTFLEIALSYLSIQEGQSSFTHSDSVNSWASLLQSGYRWLVVNTPTGHALFLGMFLIGLLTLASRLTAWSVRAR